MSTQRRLGIFSTLGDMLRGTGYGWVVELLLLGHALLVIGIPLLFG